MGSMTSSLSLLRSIHLSPGASKDYRSSHTLTLLNPHTYPSNADTISIHLPSSFISHLSDERILALLTEGFFGGPIFRIESWLLRAGLWKVVGLPHEATQSAQHIWNASSLPSNKILPLYSTIFGSFQVLASHVPSEEHHYPRYSFVDFGYGTSHSSFAGNHRFITRRPSLSPPPVMSAHPDAAIKDDDSLIEELQEIMANPLGKDEIEIKLEMYYCNPSNPKGNSATKVNWLHTLYGRLLFWDGMRRVVRAREKEGSKRA